MMIYSETKWGQPTVQGPISIEAIIIIDIRSLLILIIRILLFLVHHQQNTSPESGITKVRNPLK